MAGLYKAFGLTQQPMLPADAKTGLPTTWLVQDLARLPEKAKNDALAAENKRLREALLRVRHWSMGGNYHGGTVADLRQWIDGGMTGELPEYPAHLPPTQHTEGAKP